MADSFLKKGTKKPPANISARGRDHTSRGTTSIRRLLTKTASRSIRQCPSSVTGGPVPLYLAKAVPRTTQEMKFQTHGYAPRTNRELSEQLDLHSTLSPSTLLMFRIIQDCRPLVKRNFSNAELFYLDTSKDRLALSYPDRRGHILSVWTALQGDVASL